MRPRTSERPGARGRRGLLRVAAIAAGLLVCSCTKAPAVDSFPWTSEAGARLAFHEASGWEPGSEGSFGSDRVSNRYTLDAPLGLKAGQALELGLRLKAGAGPVPPRIRVGLGSPARKAPPIAAAEFPVRDARTDVVLAIDADCQLASVSVEIGGALEKAGLVLERIAIVPAFRGLERIEGGHRVSSDFSMRIEGGRRIIDLTHPFLARPPAAGQRMAILLGYGAFSGEASAELRGGAKPHRLRLRNSGGRTAFGPEMFGQGLEGLELSLPERVPVDEVFCAAVPEKEAELADLGRVLLSAPAEPGADYELYRWDILPSVVILDFKDYATQDLYLKRLAFFVEKAGFRGRLAPDDEIAPLHGWNAHDYRAEDLAAFFDRARSEAFPLGQTEKGLEALLLDRGIIVSKGARIGPGSGALISISRESAAYQRLTLLVHESTHGIFFTDPAYRDFVKSRWAAVTKDERWFWRLYFDWANYDVGSDYLMANEYQAYLLQQPVARAKDYFTKTLPSRLVEKHPERQAPLDAYMLRYGELFAEGASALEAWLARKYGIGAGRTWFLD
ncbi:MAG TPA: hypothetical protein VFL04_04780 [Rectinemataceae bacterium]|nr:hypothetical protein [Rectinemataceae bacterium]